MDNSSSISIIYLADLIAIIDQYLATQSRRLPPHVLKFCTGEFTVYDK